MSEIKEYTWNLSVDEINYIISGLQELPAKIANPIIQKIHIQANEQFAKEAVEKQSIAEISEE